MKYGYVELFEKVGVHPLPANSVSSCFFRGGRVGHAPGRYIGSDVVCEQRFFRFTRVSEYACRGGADDEAGQTSVASLAQSAVVEIVRSRQPTKASATITF